MDYNGNPPGTDTRLKLWRRLDCPGHELARLTVGADGAATLRGTTIFADDGEPTMITYEISCDARWRTRRAYVVGTRGHQGFDLTLGVDSSGRWDRNGEPLPVVAGCVDADLSFTPATNLLPIRRLALAVGASAPVRAAWLRFPELTVEVLEQTYTRVADHRYAYESGHGAFRTELEVDDVGFVVHYPNLWKAE